MGCCTTDPKMDENEFDAAQKRIDKSKTVTDKDAWSHVKDLWSKHGLKKEEAIKFDEAKPFIK